MIVHLYLLILFCIPANTLLFFKMLVEIPLLSAYIGCRECMCVIFHCRATVQLMYSTVEPRYNEFLTISGSKN